jgi:uncharacterized protein (TIGR03083 family)
MSTDQRIDTRPRERVMDRELAMRLAGDEYAKVVDLLETLTPEQWSAPTSCEPWDVRDMVGHMLGMMQMAASVPETVRQAVVSLRRGRKQGILTIDAMTALQIEKNAGLSTAELVDEVRRFGPKAAQGRRRTPGFVRRLKMPELQDVGGLKEPWTFGYLLDVILTRDPFLHRTDIAEATGVTLVVTAEHEGVIVDDVVRDWTSRHDEAYDLELTGPAGGRWRRGEAETITMDALEFCRVLSGRGIGSGPLAVRVPF